MSGVQGRKVFVALSTFAKEGKDPLDLLVANKVDFQINPHQRRLTQEEILECGAGYEGIIAGLEPYDAKVLEGLKGLKCISRCGVGVDNIDLKKAKERNITVLNTPEVVVQPVAELTIAMIFDLLRRLTTHTILMRQKKWERQTGYLLSGKKVAVIGLGRIGRRVAQMLKSLGVEVLGSDIVPPQAWAQKHGIKILPWMDALKLADIVTLHVTLDPAHPFSLGHKEIRHMKKGAFLVNVSRGALLEEHSLVEALQSGHLAGAGLDVYEQEPYAGPLCDLSNVVLTPHIATLTQESRLQMEIEATQNMINFLKGI